MSDKVFCHSVIFIWPHLESLVVTDSTWVMKLLLNVCAFSINTLYLTFISIMYVQNEPM